MSSSDYIHEKHLVTGNYCSSCQKIPWGDLIEEANCDSYDGLGNSSCHILHATISDFNTSVRGQCPLCSCLWQYWQKSDARKGECISIQTSSSRMKSGEFGESWIKVHFSSLEQNLARDWDDWESKWHISLHHDHAVSRTLANRVVPARPLSDLAVSTYKKWLADCIAEHPKCNELLTGLSNAVMPTRLIRIGARSDPYAYLMHTVGSQNSFDYAALSHCWGLEQNCTTTRDTLQAHKDGILICQLPKTFQDAIEVIRKLKLSYIWIDSLCIIQDDLQDWEIESARMGSIYKNSHVTIAASRSASDKDGFLKARTIALKSNSIQFYEPVPGFFISDWQPGNSERQIWDAPLGKRAWVIQERYLACRSIYFAECQSFWTCQQFTAAENGKISSKMTSSVPRMIQYMLSPRINNDGHVSTVAVLPEDGSWIESSRGPYDDWYAMVSKYTSCAITKSSDRLPALSGLATEVANRTNDNYYAGIWGKAIIEGLLWFCHDAKTLAYYRAPSWSWASINGKIDFQACWGRLSLATTIHIEIESSSSNLYGEVTGGSLTIEAPFLRVESCVRPAVPGRWCPSHLLVQIYGKWYSLATHFDIPADETKPLYVLALVQRKYDLLGIVLVPTGHDVEQYRRSGFVSADLLPLSAKEIFGTELAITEKSRIYTSADWAIHPDLSLLPREQVTLV